MDQSTTLSVRKIRYVRDNMPARVRDVRKGYITYTGRGHKGEWGIQRCSRVKDVRSNFLRPSNPFEFFCRTNPFVHIPQCFLHSVNVKARNLCNELECN